MTDKPTLNITVSEGSIKPAVTFTNDPDVGISRVNYDYRPPEFIPKQYTIKTLKSVIQQFRKELEDIHCISGPVFEWVGYNITKDTVFFKIKRSVYYVSAGEFSSLSDLEDKYKPLGILVDFEGNKINRHRN